jgi:hypothetical protein
MREVGTNKIAVCELAFTQIAAGEFSATKVNMRENSAGQVPMAKIVSCQIGILNKRAPI